MDNKELDDKIERMQTEISDGFSDMNKVTATLFLFLKDGTTKLLDVELMCNAEGITPGEMIHKLKPRLRKDINIQGIMFMAEAWMVSTKECDNPPDEVKELLAGNKTPSECSCRVEALLFSTQTRVGKSKLYKHLISRDVLGRGTLTIDLNPMAVDGGEGNLVNIF